MGGMSVRVVTGQCDAKLWGVGVRSVCPHISSRDGLVAHSNFLAGVGTERTGRANAGITQVKILPVTHTRNIALCGAPSSRMERWPIQARVGLEWATSSGALNSILKQCGPLKASFALSGGVQAGGPGFRIR